MPRQVVIVDSRAHGHHIEYIAYLALWSPRIESVQVTVVAPRGSEKKLMTEMGPGVRIPEIRELDSSSIPRVLRSLVTSCEFEEVWIPSADHLVYRQLVADAGRTRQTRLRGVLLRSPFMAPRNWIRDSAKRLLLKPGCLSANVKMSHLVGPGQENAMIPLIRDVSRFKRSSDSEITKLLCPQRRWVGVFGRIDDRKNVPLLLEGLSQERPSAYGLVLAGRSGLDWTRKRLRQGAAKFTARGGHIVVIDRELDETELDALVDSVDCVACLHSNEGPSGVALKAAAAGQRLVLGGAKTLEAMSLAVPSAFWSALEATSVANSVSEALSFPRPAPFTFGTPETFAREFAQTAQRDGTT